MCLVIQSENPAIRMWLWVNKIELKMKDMKRYLARITLKFSPLVMLLNGLQFMGKIQAQLELASCVNGLHLNCSFIYFKGHRTTKGLPFNGDGA